jgi:penicillin amidase
MRALKKILLGILLLIILLIVLGFVYTRTLKPQYSGSLELKNLNTEVHAYIDEYGIPHIYAKNETDAFTALGYLHAQDRLWQMELVRRIAPGRLSEILGKDLLKTDKFFVTLGIDEASEKAVAELNKNSDVYKLTMAYLNGVNQFIEEGFTPIEYTLLGAEKEPYTLKDVYNVFGYMAFSFAQAQKTDPLLTTIQDKLGADYLKDLDVVPNANGTLIYNSNPHIENIESLSTDIAQIMNKLPVPAFVGSNGWVASPKKTSTGAVLFANDPHIGYAQPSVWYEAHISTPDYEMYGYHLAGVPFPVLGHNRNIAYGMTMFENDDIDFFKETNHETDKKKYKTPNGYEDYKIALKTVKVKDEEDVVLEVKSSRHGPIMNGIQDEISGDDPIALSWIYTQHKIEVLEAIYKLSHANGLETAREAVSMIHAPGLNVMYGDAIGNVAWWAAGKLYKHQEHVNPKFILDGASGADDIVEFLDFEQNPMAENPEWEYVYSANNQPDSIAGIMYPGYYLPEDRAKRIVQLLKPKNDWDKDSFATMITDATSAVAPAVVTNISASLNKEQLSDFHKEALLALTMWKGDSNLGSVGATIYQRVINKYLINTYKDDLGATLYKQLLSTHFIKRAIAIQITSEESAWWDDASTNVKESKQDILTKSFMEAIDALETQFGNDISTWTWNKVHTLEHPHALGAIEALRSYFNVGPFETGGMEEVIDNKAFNFNDEGFYPANVGPSTRRIVDFSDVENSISILPTGQSGNPFSDHYDDQALMYSKGEFRKMMMNKEEIIEKSTLLSISPKN